MLSDINNIKLLIVNWRNDMYSIMLSVLDNMLMLYPEHFMHYWFSCLFGIFNWNTLNDTKYIFKTN